jgi:apolipoprotein N-acyltransferase
MAFAFDFRRIAIALVVVATASAMVWFGTGLFPVWPLLWFAPLPVLLFAGRSPRWAAALTAALAWALGSLNMWHYFSAALHMPPPVRVGIVAVPALVFMLAVLLYRALLAFPAAWVSFEYVFNLTSPHGSAVSLSYSQLNCLPILQLASITGP